MRNAIVMRLLRASYLLDRWAAKLAHECPCQTDVDDQGPRHLSTCPWRDPAYDLPPPWGVMMSIAVGERPEA